MTGVQREHYGVIDLHANVLPFAVIDAADPCGYGVVVDRFASKRSAVFAAELLNSGEGFVSPHASLGCRVVLS